MLIFIDVVFEHGIICHNIKFVIYILDFSSVLKDFASSTDPGTNICHMVLNNHKLDDVRSAVFIQYHRNTSKFGLDLNFDSSSSEMTHK